MDFEIFAFKAQFLGNEEEGRILSKMTLEGVGHISKFLHMKFFPFFQKMKL